MKQLSLDLGKELKEAGMQRAIDNAERVNPGWKETAFQFLCDFVRTTNSEFMTENVREASKGIVPEPPNHRAWGGIVARAAHAGLIRKIGHKAVKNAKAHSAFASVWRAA